MLRPACCVEKSPAPSNSVFVDSTRSAAPPTIVGVNGLSACITFLPASRRGDLLAGRELGQRLDPARAAACRCGRRPSPRAAPGTPRPSARSRCCHSCSPLDPLRAHVHVLVDLVGDVEVLVGIEPERLLRRRDLLLAERRAVRLRRVDRLRRAVGDVAADDDQRRRAPARPAPPAIARSIASTSSESAIDCTCQPCASKRFALSSVVKVSAVVPSIVMWLSS